MTSLTFIPHLRRLAVYTHTFCDRMPNAAAVRDHNAGSTPIGEFVRVTREGL